MPAETGTAYRPYIAPGVVRTSPKTPPDAVGWRQGPPTSDGYWMVMRYPRGGSYWAVRVILDPLAPMGRLFDALEDALYARSQAAQDDYLASLTEVAAMPVSELAQLREAVREGRAGGAFDGGK